MKCNKKYILPDFIQNKLSPIETATVIEHIGRCKTCANEYKNLKKTFSELANEKQPEPDEIYWTNLLPNIHKKINADNFNYYIKYIPQIVASAAVLIIVSLLMIKLYNYFEYNRNIQANTEIMALIDSIYQEQLFDYSNDVFIDKSDNDSENFIIRNIILTSNDIEQLYKEDTSISELRDEEVNELLSYLNREKNYKR